MYKVHQNTPGQSCAPPMSHNVPQCLRMSHSKDDKWWSGMIFSWEFQWKIMRIICWWLLMLIMCWGEQGWRRRWWRWWRIPLMTRRTAVEHDWACCGRIQKWSLHQFMYLLCPWLILTLPCRASRNRRNKQNPVALSCSCFFCATWNLSQLRELSWPTVLSSQRVSTIGDVVWH